MWQIPVYKAEKKDGIGDLVKATSSLTYASQLINSEINKSRINHCLERIISAAKPNLDKQIDLHYLDTILVTTGWNNNTDIFEPIEVWAARATPEDKMFNFGHSQDDIIGHMTASYAVDEQYSLLDDGLSADELPQKFHLLTSAVLYKVLENETKQTRINKIIAEIADNKWFVSMEALFRNFDYGMLSSKGEYRVVARNEETSILTKYLRQYGGVGTYQDYSIGRVLRNITFCGKGLVSNPANPESLILTDNANFKGVGSTSVYIKLSELDKLTEITMAETQTDPKVAELETKVVSLTSELTASKAETDKVKADLTAKSEEVTKLAKDKSDLEVKVADLTKDKTLAERTTFLLGLNANAEQADAVAKKLMPLSEEDFKQFVDTNLKGAWNPETKTVVAEATATEVLDAVVVDKTAANLNVDPAIDVATAEKVKADELSTFLAIVLDKTKK